MNKARTFTELTSSAAMGGVEHILKRSQRLKQLDSLLGKVLDAELCKHCRVANIRERTLILHVSSTAWMTRLRYQLPRLLEELRQESSLTQLQEIQLRVEPPAAPKAEHKQVRRAAMSADAAHCIESCASSIEDAQLRSALERLARRGNKRS